METIFDYNPTDEELKRFGGRKAFEHLISVGYDILSNHDDNCWQLGILFSMRGDKKKAQEYFDKIEKRSMLGTLMQDF